MLHAGCSELFYFRKISGKSINKPTCVACQYALKESNFSFSRISVSSGTEPGFLRVQSYFIFCLHTVNTGPQYFSFGDAV